MIPTPRSSAPLRLRRLPDRIAAARAIDVAEAFRDLPGLVLLESARPGRNARWTYLTADPVAVLETPAAGPDPFAVARRLVARLDRTVVVPADAPPFLGGLVGFLGYDLGREPRAPAGDRARPTRTCRRSAWRSMTGSSPGTGGPAMPGSPARALDGDGRRLARRLDDVHARLVAPARPRPVPPALGPIVFRSGLDRRAYEAGVERVRRHIADGDIYQANLTRRLEAPFDGDPWDLYRRLRTGDPSLFSAYLDLGPGQLTGHPRALLSASPEPFLSVDAEGVVKTDPIKGTRPRGRDAATDRALARELLSSDKDRAENVMIVDVLRNDLGRVCRPGSVRVPRLCRLERTAAVQHLVSTVTGVLADGRDAFDLLAASFPGRLDHRRTEDPRDGDPRGSRAGPARPVHRRHRLDRARRRDADEHRHPDLRGRWPPAHPPRRRRHHLEERPGRRVGGDGDQGARPARGDRRRGGRVTEGAGHGDRFRRPTAHVWVDGRLLDAGGPHLSVFDRGFQLGDGIFETLRVRGGHPTELAEHTARLRTLGGRSRHPAPRRHRRAAGDRDRRAAGRRRPRRRDRRRVVRITVSRGAFRGRGLLPPDEVVAPTIAIQAWPVVPASAEHLERGLHLIASSVRRDPASPLAALKTTSRADYVYARLEARRAGADDALFLTIDDELSEGTTANIFLVRAAARRGDRARDPVARLRDPARHDPLVAARPGASGSGSAPSRRG